MVKYEVNDLDDFERKLDKMTKAAEELDEQGSVSFKELFCDTFMTKYTKYTTIEEFVEASGCDFSLNEFNVTDKKALDLFVKNNSSFNKWAAMESEAVGDYLARKLGFEEFEE